jgi:FMN phosphatase YigB (HAD superfamily)
MDEPDDPRLLHMSLFLVDYPFANRLFPGGLDAIAHLKRYGPTVILSDGDVVFQPRKVERSGLWEAVDGNVLIYVHKEEMLYAVERRYPADHYVIVDDKLRILAAVRTAWGKRVTTVFARQGHYAHDPRILAEYPPADVADLIVDRIGDLATIDLKRESSHETNATVPRPWPEPVARQRHARPDDQPNTRALHQAAICHRPYLEPDDLR